ncbi:MAG: zinc-binding dehydrogenase [Desulfobacterales bacterium]|nr:MAG: zinc-binding dehydrogenase [Desulfobacterales bacterium]
MKAMVLEEFGGPENFQWKDWPTPEIKPGEVLIRIHAVSLNPVDYKMRAGHLPIPLPDVLGRDAAGTVEAVGEGVTAFRDGDNVFAVLFGPRSNGAYAQYVRVPAAFVCPKPDSLSFQQAACLGVAGMTAYDAVVNKGRIQRGETVLVAGGAGGVGSFAIPLMRYCGVTSIIATTGGDESANHLINSLGIDSKNLIYYQKLSLKEMDARVRELTDGKGIAVAFDFVGGDMKKLCFNAAGFDGRVVSTVEEPPEFDFNIWRADISPLFAKAGTYHFVALSARARNGGPDDWGVYRDMMAGLARLVEAGHLTLPKATDLGELTEENIRKAHTLLEAGHVKGKLVLSVG